MAHFAELNSNNVVLRVLVFSNEDINNYGGDLSIEAEQWIESVTPHIEGGVSWKQTSYNNNFRKKYAGKEFTYDPVNNIFISPKPFISWTLNSNFEWIPPVPNVIPKPHSDWVQDTEKWDIYNAQWGWKPPLAHPTIIDYDNNGEVKGYDCRWDRNRSSWCAVKHDGSLVDWNSETDTWVASVITEAPPLGTFYKTNWDETNQKWTAVNLLDNTINYEWNIQTQTWDLI